MIKDMTKGPPFKIILQFALPMLISMAFQQLYIIADSVIVGKYAGVDALAAVGVSYPVTVLFIAIATGACIAVSVLVAHIFGSKQFAEMKTAVSTAIISVTLLSVFLTLLGLLLCDPLLKLMNTPENIFSDAKLYLMIYICGVVFLFVYNVATAIFNALGNSKTPLVFLILSSALNIGLDLLFVTRFHKGVAGVAYATFISQGLAAVLSLSYLLYKIHRIHTNEKYRKFDINILKRLTPLAIPSIMQQSFISVGQLFVQGLINSYGSNAVAGYSAAFKINTFAIMIILTMSSALSSFTAQNIGAGRLERVKNGYKASGLLTFSIAAVMITVILIFDRTLVGLFIDDMQNKEVIRTGIGFLKIAVPFYVVCVSKIITDGVLRGAGDMKAFLAGTFSDLILRVSFSYILEALFGLYGVWWAYPIGWVAGAAVSLFFYRKGRWKTIKLAG